MRLKLTLTLLAILLGLLTYIFFIDGQEEDPANAGDKGTILGGLAVDLDYLSIQNNTTGQTVTLERENGTWAIKEPYLWPANDFAVQRILTELRFLKRISSFDSGLAAQTGVSLAAYGLLPSNITVRLGRGGQTDTLGIGNPTEIGNNLYVLSPDRSKVHVVDLSLLDALTVSLDELRSPRLFDIAVFEATSWNIQVREDDRNLRAWFARQGDKWVFETPISARADTAAVNTLLNRCLSLEAAAIVAPNPTDLSPYGLQNPTYRIAVESEQSREVLEIGQKIAPDSDMRYAKRESRPGVFQLRIDFLDLLANAQTKLRERRIFELDVTEATTLTIEQRSQQPLTLQKLEDDTWEIVTRDQGQGMRTLKGDTEAITQILQWLNQLKAVPDTGFRNDAPSAPNLESYGLEVPETTLTITSTKRFGQDAPLESADSETLLIGDPVAEDPNESYVKIEGKDFVYSVYNDILTSIETNPLSYQDRQLIALNSTNRITRLQVERLSDRSRLLDTGLDSNSSPQAVALAAEIAALTVESYRPEGYTRTIEIAGRETSWAYRITATLAPLEPNRPIPEPIRLLVSETTGGPLLYGAIPSSDLSFRFRIGFIDAFSEIVFPRTPQPKPENPFSPAPLSTPPADSAPRAP